MELAEQEWCKLLQRCALYGYERVEFDLFCRAFLPLHEAGVDNAEMCAYRIALESETRDEVEYGVARVLDGDSDFFEDE